VDFSQSTRAFGRRIRFLRKLEGWTQAQLAEQAGISLEHLNKLERGAAAPSFKSICQLARALHTEPANLLLFSDGEDAPSERRADALRHISGLGGWRQDLLSGKIVASAGLCRLLGLPPRQITSERCPVEPLVAAADKAVYDEAHERLLRGESVGPMTFRIRRTDGETRHVAAMAEPVCDAFGVMLGSHGCIVDITEPLRLERSLCGTREILERRVQERTERLDQTIARLGALIAEHERTARILRETEGHMRLILDSLPILVAQVDREERILFVNDRYARYRGGVPADYIGRSVREVVGEETYENLSRENVRKALGGIRSIDEIRLAMPDGSRPYLYAQWIPSSDDQGRVDSMFYWALDISERKFAEEVLRQSEERFRVLVESLPDIYWVIDANGLSYLSPAFERYFDLSLEQARENPARILDHIHPEDRDAPARVLLRAWSEDTRYDYTVRVRNRTGEILLDVHNAPVRDANGDVVQVVGVARRVCGD